MGSASGWRAVEDASCRRADYCFVGLVRFPYRWLQRVDAVEEVGGESDEAWLVDDRGTACRIWGFVLAPVGIGLNADATN
jgi:hypothetical protein